MEYLKMLTPHRESTGRMEVFCALPFYLAVTMSRKLLIIRPHEVNTNSIMSTSYKESARRHINDAEHLWATSVPARLPNASQLFGLGAECAIKAVLIGLGLATRPDGSLMNYRKYGHLPNLWQEFSSYAAGQLGGKYAGLLNSASTSSPPFSGWDVGDRYKSNATLAAQAVDFNNHRGAALDCVALLELAMQDGIVL